MNIKKFKVNGYLLVLETGEYSNYAEEWFLFNKIPDLDVIWEEIKLIPKRKLDYSCICDVLEKHGGQPVPRIVTIKADWEYATFHNNITGKEYTRDEREWTKK